MWYVDEVKYIPQENSYLAAQLEHGVLIRTPIAPEAHKIIKWTTEQFSDLPVVLYAYASSGFDQTNYRLTNLTVNLQNSLRAIFKIGELIPRHGCYRKAAYPWIFIVAMN